MYTFGGAFIWDRLLGVEVLIKGYKRSKVLGNYDHSALQKTIPDHPCHECVTVLNANSVL